jgi:hypothetical protein
MLFGGGAEGMASRRQRDEWTEFARQSAAELRGWVRRRFCEPGGHRVRRLLIFLLMKLPRSRVLAAIGMPICLFGWIVALAWPLTALVSAWTNGFALATTEFPLGDPSDVAVDSHGRLYVVDSLHLRVQRYSPDGEFERGWFVPRKVFAVRTTADDLVIVGAEGGPRTYSSDGELLEVVEDGDELRRQGLVRGKEPTGQYAVRRGLRPHVIERETGRTVVATPWPLRLIASPFPACLYLLLGVAWVGLADLRRWRERAAPTPNTYGEGVAQ